LGMLLVGKGNMSAMFNTGYFQLAASQAYFPWIIAGVLGIFTQPQRRWPPVMLALSATLLLFAGNVWYTLPMAICAAAVAAAYLIRRPMIHSVGRRHVAHLLFAGVLTLAISAALFIPLWIHQGQIGNHPPEVRAGWIIPLWRTAVPFYFNGDPRQTIARVMDPLSGNVNGYWIDQLEEIYFSFVTPAWLVLLLFVLIPIYRPRGRRIWIAAWILLAFFTLWGAGGQPLFLFLYEKIPFLQGWRFVGRALAVGSFWIAVLVAMRADSLWHILPTFSFPFRRQQNTAINSASRSTLHLARSTALRLLLTAACLFAAWEVNQGWNVGVNNILNPINANAVCLDWLRAQNPDSELTVWQWGYTGVTAFLNNHIRIFDVMSDFEMSPVPNTLGHLDLTRSLPQYAIGWTTGDRMFLRDNGYKPITDGPRLPEERQAHLSCLHRKADALTYAYTVSLTTLDELRQPAPTSIYPEPPIDLILTLDKTTPVTTYVRQPDNITFLVQGDPSGEAVLTLQERAFPGWEVHLDGTPAKLESVGGQLGVILPADDRSHRVYFVYRPPLFFLGAVITLLACGFSILYLLRIDRFFRKNADLPVQQFRQSSPNP
jgi:hypothetical protein